TLRSTLNRARRDAEMPQSARTKAEATATASADRMVIDVRNTATAMAAGIASTASVPKMIAAMRAGLLLDIRTAVGGRGHRPPDHAGDRDERENVREGLEERAGAQERGGRVDVRGGNREGERGREPE